MAKEIVTVNVNLDAPTSTRRGFTTPLYLGSVSFTERVRSYSGPEQLREDETNGDISAAIRDEVLDAYNQDPHVPDEILIGRREPDQKQVTELTVNATGGDGTTWAVTYNGTEYTYEETSGDDDTDIASGIDSAISYEDSDSSTVTSATIEITAGTEGSPFDLSEPSTNEGDYTITETTPNISIATEIQACVEALENKPESFYGWSHEITGSDSSEKVKDVERGAEWSESSARLYVPQFSELESKQGDENSLAKTLFDQNYEYTVPVFFNRTEDEAVGFAWMSAKLSKSPDNGTAQWSFYTLTGIAVDDLSSREKDNLRDWNVNYYRMYKGDPVMYKGVTCAGRKVSVRITADWLEARIKENSADTFKSISNDNGKIGFGNDGITNLEQDADEVLSKGETVENLEPGSSETNFPTLSEVSSNLRQRGRLEAKAGARPVNPITEVEYDITISADFTGF